MVGKINGQTIFCYSCPDTKTKIKKIKNKYYVSLLGIIVGIFLLPNIAYLSSVTAEKLVELTNNERIKNEINSLTVNELLTEAAQNKAEDILKEQTFRHNFNNKKFSNWIKDTGYNYSYVGENLAIDFMTSEGVIKAWKDSELHNKNIINPRFKEIGIAVTEGDFKGHNAVVVVQIFGEPVGNTQGEIPNVNSLLTQTSTERSSMLNIEDNEDEKQFAGIDSSGANQFNNLFEKKFNQTGIMSSTPIFILGLKNKNNINSKYLLFIFYILSTTLFSILILPVLFINAFYSKKFLKNLFRSPIARKHIRSVKHSPVKF